MKLQASEQLMQIPQIESSRLLLRSFEAADFETAYRLFSDADVQKYLSPENKRTRERLRKRRLSACVCAGRREISEFGALAKKLPEK